MKAIIVTIPIPHLCVVTAADIEFNAVVRQLEEPIFSETDQLKRCHGRVGRNRVTLLQCAVGAPGFKEKLTAHLTATKYDVLFIMGLAGALKPDLKTGQVVFYDTCFAFRPEFDAPLNLPPETSLPAARAATATDAASVCDFQVSSALRQLLLADGMECNFGAGLSLDFMVTSADEKLSLGESYSAVAVDMESYDLIQAGTESGLPVVVLRVVLDEAEQKTPDFNLALAPNGQMSTAKSLFAMLLRPVAALRFFCSLPVAMKTLRRASKLALQAEPKLIRPARPLVLTRKMRA